MGAFLVDEGRFVGHKVRETLARGAYGSSMAGGGCAVAMGGMTFAAAEGEPGEGSALIFSEGEGGQSGVYVRLAASMVTGRKAMMAKPLSEVTLGYLRGLVGPDELLGSARAMGVAEEAPRQVLCVRCRGRGDVGPSEVLTVMYAKSDSDYVVALGESDFALVREEREGGSGGAREAGLIADTVGAEAMVDVKVAVGPIFGRLDGLADSYAEALETLELGLIFGGSQRVFACGRFGVERLMRGCDAKACDEFLGGIGPGIDRLDAEHLSTADSLFRHGLNVSETSRRTYIHRNTLVYRIEKIERLTGLNVTVFEDALKLKLAILIRRYRERQAEVGDADV